MVAMKSLGQEILDYVNPILGRIGQFDLSDAEAEAVDGWFDRVQSPARTEDAVERNALVAVANVVDAWERWKEARPLLRPGLTVSAGGAFVQAIHDLSEAIEPPLRVLVEPMHELVAQQVSLLQVAKMHDLRDDAGEPSPSRVREEMAKGPEKCYRRERVRLKLDLTGDYESALKRLERALERRGAVRVAEGPRERPPAPESFFSLGRQQVPLHQIAKMKRVTESEAEAELKALGLVVPGMRAVLDLASADALQATPPDETKRLIDSIRRSTAAGFDPGKPVKSNVAKLAKAGFSVAEVEQAFRDQAGTAPDVEAIADAWPKETEKSGA